MLTGEEGEWDTEQSYHKSCPVYAPSPKSFLGWLWFEGAVTIRCFILRFYPI